MNLNDLKPHQKIAGLLVNRIIEIIYVKPHGDSFVEITYKDDRGELGNQMISVDELAELNLVESSSQWKFDSNSEDFRLVSEAYRMSVAYLFEAYLAIHSSLIEPLPHQISAVYEKMLQQQPLRFVLADDPGAGKTIMAGLLIKELMVRSDVLKCLIVCPRTLADQWQEELQHKFHLNFEILTSERISLATSGNVFADVSCGIVSLDVLYQKEFTEAIEMEKQLLSAMFMKEGLVVPDVAAIIDPDDLYRPEHRLIFHAILRLFAKKQPIDYLAVEEELRKTGDFGKIDHGYLLSLIDATFTTARAEYHANIIKEKANFRKIIELGDIIIDQAQRGEKSPADISFFAQQYFNNITRSVAPSKKASFPDFFANNFNPAIEEMKAYANRLSGFDNLDQQQFFSPGLYVIGATPAAGKTTFCWQLLEQLAQRGESCIFCSYEMSQLELFSKSLARELFKRVPATNLTAADIRRGSHSVQLANIIDDFANSKLNLSILELQDESIDELLSLLKPFCYDKAKDPVICLDYLQIVPSSKDSTKLGVDDSVRKLKKFQRDTNITFIVISSFNRDNYTKPVSFESFKESGNIEYTADVVWALQLFVINSINSFNISDARQKIDKAKKQQPRQIQLKCLKNRQGTNYDCFFNYFSAHDCFIPCEKFGDDDASSDNPSTNSHNNNKRNSKRV